MEVASDNIIGFPMGPLEMSCHWKYNGLVEIQWGMGTPMGYGNSNGRSLVGPRQGVEGWGGLVNAYVSYVFQYCTMHYGPDSWVVMSSCMGVQSRGTPTFLCIIFNHYHREGLGGLVNACLTTAIAVF